ncbi:MAG TPA: adenylate/guanylate cyclase domain-containing protein [Methylomirabilota bacterium]|nr:adenylate/guanylate cyclase domain-containing protein [Methylomirabilota bacterium]
MRSSRAAIRRTLVGSIVPQNLLGAVVTWVYFRYVDPVTAVPGVDPVYIVFSIIALAVLVGGGYRIGRRWTGSLAAAVDQVGLPPTVQRRALLVPYVMAGISFLGWTLAGLVWGVGWPALTGTITWAGSLRSVFGVTFVAGSVAAITSFLMAERQWRRVLPLFFAEGTPSRVRGVPRLPVRARLLLVFVIVGVLPMAVLGVVSYTRALALVGAPPVAADELVRDLLVLIVFLLAVGVAAAVVLAVLVSRSVGEPLATLAGAMAQVEGGRLDTRCPVVSRDEIGEVTEGFNQMVQGLRERERVTEMFGKYVSREIRDEILAGRVSLEGTQAEVTVLFSDLRDFTPWVEATDPREVVHDLNAYFSEMEGAIRASGGLVLQYIGDEIEAVFGAPVADGRHADQAVRAACEMSRRLAAWNGERARVGKAPLRHDIGIHTGTVLAGSIGSRDRLSYALVGDAVNLASRIQSLTKELGTEILVSAATQARLTDPSALARVTTARVKGRSDEVEVYRLSGGAT